MTHRPCSSRSILTTLICAGLIFTLACSSRQQIDGGFGAGIKPEALKAHLEFLADDALEGRRTGTRGHNVAAKYVAAQFSAIGLKGGMPDGSFYQQVPLRRTEVIPETTSMTLSGNGMTLKLRYGTDFLLFDTHQAAQGSFSMPVVFAGYGVSAPELNYDDYAGLDVKGKIVAVLMFEAPSKFAGPIRGYYMDNVVKREAAIAHGASGILQVPTPGLQKSYAWKSMQRELAIGGGSMRWLDAKGQVHGLDPRLGPAPALNGSAAEALFEGEQHSLAGIFAAAEKGEPPHFAIRKTATVRYRSRHTAVESVNVVALMAGADPGLKSEYVVFSTHMDHLGIGPVVDGDAIYNGAMDNASGCATLLEIAHAFSQLPQRPRRSVMFVAVTGEEQGMLGSEYFAGNSPVPLQQLVANINFDGTVPFMPGVRDVIAYGGAHSSLGRVADVAAAESGFDVSPDPYPEEGIFVRTDHYSFVKQGIPALFVDTGVKSSDPSVDVLKARKQWLMTVYHSPKDDATQKFDYTTGARFARFAGLLGYKVAMEAERPKWNDGDFFGKRFAHGGVK